MNEFLKYILLFIIGFVSPFLTVNAEELYLQKKKIKYIDAISTHEKDTLSHLTYDDLEFLIFMRDSLQLDSIQTELGETIRLKDLPEIADDSIVKPAYEYIIFESTKRDSLFMLSDFISESEKTIALLDVQTIIHKADSIINTQKPLSRYQHLLYANNPLLIDLVHFGWKLNPVKQSEFDYTNLFYGEIYDPLSLTSSKYESSESFVSQLHQGARSYLTANSLYSYKNRIDNLPDISKFTLRSISGAEVTTIHVIDEKIKIEDKISLNQIKRKYWIKKANALLQFSQNHVSSNWHQGGNSNYSFLSILNGELNYNNQKNVIWENRMEWRLGYNNVQSDRALRKLNINDDMLRFNTKFGVRASGNWYYSISGEALTQLFNNYQSFDSENLRSRLLTPVRANVGVGMDYKYKSFSLTLAPLSFKYIYLNDTVNINPNQFGIQKGENQLKQFGSTMRSELKLKPMRDWNFDSRLSFYTDYKKVEIDMEIVNNFVINRFLTARLQINPRFDNTIILKEGEKSKIQYKELLSIGFSYRFL